MQVGLIGLPQAGKAQLTRKEYIVEEGDILNFRFNV